MLNFEKGLNGVRNEFIKCYKQLIKQCKRELKNCFWIRDNFNLSLEEKAKLNKTIIKIKKDIKAYKLKLNQLTGKVK